MSGRSGDEKWTPRTAEIIAIGDELITGQRVDTNTAWLASQLAMLGVQPLWHTTVGDSMDQNIEAFRIASQRADWTVATGGLGPTADDLTRHAIGEAFGRPLVLCQASLEAIEALFSGRKRPMPERNRVQAYFPQGCQVIPNRHGTAPGIDLWVPEGCGQSGHRVMAFPGVPAEMKAMWHQIVRPRILLETNLAKRSLSFQTVKLFGIGESEVETLVPNLIDRDRDPKVGITASQATITLRISSLGSDPAQAIAFQQPTLDLIHAKLAPWIFGSGEMDLEDAVVMELDSHHQTAAVVEVGASPRLAYALCRPGSGRAVLRNTQWFPDLPSLARTLHLPPSSSIPEGTSEDLGNTLVAAARRAKESHGSDWGIACGYLPEQNAMEQSPGKTFPWTTAIVGPDGLQTLDQVQLGGHPDVLPARLIKHSMHRWWKQLTGKA
jgi:nicotinamide-nucleotide amidase